MTVIVTWRCDGCDESVDSTVAKAANWQKITVCLGGFIGYPVGDYANRERAFELCPACQKLLRARADPKAWTRVDREAAQ